MASEARSVVRLRVLRQDAIDKPDTRRWEEFDVEARPDMTVHDCLEQLQRRPANRAGNESSPVAWEASCLDGSCGACTMLIQNQPRLACTTLVSEVAPRGQLTLAPLSKFPVERDLVVDRSKMFGALERVRAWVAIEGPSQGAPITEGPDDQRRRLALSACIGCGACLEACPEVHDGAAFIGAAAINQARAIDLHPLGALDRRARVESLMGPGGVADCGKAQNCVEVCPANIPLVDSIGHMSRATTKQFLLGWLLD